jgi:hypothetical protein
LTEWVLIGDKLVMSKQKKALNVTEIKAEKAAEREKRLADALRDNLKRRKPSRNKTLKTPQSDA